MKKTILASLFLSFATSAYCQKLEKPIIDPITGDTSVLTKKEALTNPMSLKLKVISCRAVKISLAKAHASYYSLVFDILMEYGNLFSVYKGSKAHIKFTDGQVLELVTGSDKNSDIHHGSGSSVSYSCSVWYDLTNENILLLTSKEIAFIRVDSSEGPIDYEIKAKNSDVIKKHLLLITKS